MPLTPVKPTLIVFSGGMRETAVTSLIAQARDAAALDTLEHGLETDAFSSAILVTDSQGLAARVPSGVEVDLDRREFDFESRLRGLVSAHGIERPFYVGGGSFPLLATAELESLAERLRSSETVVLSNNFFSADFVAWTPGGAIDALATIPSDNRLPQLLHVEAGLPSWEMERTIASQYDIDAPSDVAILKLCGGGGRALCAYLDSLALDLAPYERAMRHFVTPGMVVVAGRVSSATWQYLERETACRIRLFSEERGMQADERERSGKVRSILGFYGEQAGVNALFHALSELGEAIFLDSRVIFAHAGVVPSRSDRFLSDLFRWGEISDPFVRELTREATQAAVPVVLGGHSLVAGGIMALVQAAWDTHDRETS